MVISINTHLKLIEAQIKLEQEVTTLLGEARALRQEYPNNYEHQRNIRKQIDEKIAKIDGMQKEIDDLMY